MGMTKTKPKKCLPEGYARVEVSRALRATIGMIAAATRETQPEVVERLLGPVADAELRRLATRDGKHK